MDYFDILLAKKLNGGGGGDITVESLSVTENGTYTAPSGKAYSPVTVEVQPPENSYQLKSITTPTSLATFEASAMPMPSLKVSVEAKQDLHGYDKPWVGGAGKNKFDGDFPNITSEIQSRTYALPNGTYTVSSNCPLNAESKANIFVKATTGAVTTADDGVWNGQSRTIVVDTGYIYIYYRNINDINPNNYNTQIELGSQSTSFAPYSNICPISGWDAANVSDVGKNKWAAGETFSKDNSATYTPKVFTLAEGTYTISGLFTTTSPDNKVRFSFRTSSPVTVALEANSGSRTSATFTLTEQCETVRVYGQDNTSDTYSATYTDVMVESGETATSFEPYVEPNLYTISLPQTVYGGEVDVVNGGGKSTFGIADMGDLSWTYDNGFFRTTGLSTLAKKPIDNNTKVNIISSMYVSEAWNSIETTDNGKFAMSSSSGQLIVCNTAYTDAASFKTAMNGVQLVYELATPTTFTTQPTPIKSLNGQNNLSVDCGEILEGEYFKALGGA